MLVSVNSASMADAEVLLASYLNAVAISVLSDRFDNYVAHVQLPFRLVTNAAQLQVETLEDLQDGFDDYVSSLRDMGVSEMKRDVTHAIFECPDTIGGVFQTRLLDGAKAVIPAFFSKIWLKRIDGQWRGTKIVNTTHDNRWPVLMHKVHSP